MSEPRFAPTVDPRRVAALPSVVRLTTVGALAVLVPGLVLFAICRAAGMATGPAGLVGLAGMLVGLGCYPVYLRRLGRRIDAELADSELVDSELVDSELVDSELVDRDGSAGS